MEIKKCYNDLPVEDNIRYRVVVTPFKQNEDEYEDKKHDIDIFISGKELKAIVELINTFSKLQESSLTGNLFNVLQKIEGFKKQKEE